MNNKGELTADQFHKLVKAHCHSCCVADGVVFQLVEFGVNVDMPRALEIMEKFSSTKVRSAALIPMLNFVVPFRLVTSVLTNSSSD